jgi:hypothetical protein
MAKTQELNFNITSENLKKIINILKDLSGIDKKAMIKLNTKELLIYSLVGEGASINAFKSFIEKTDSIFNIDEFDQEIYFIAKDIKNMYRNLEILVELNEDISGKIYFDLLGDKFYSDRLFFKSSGKLKLNFYGGDPLSINTSITVETIKKTINVDKSDFKFILTDNDFTNIKKLATSDSEIDVFYMNTYEKDGKNYVSLGESSWDLTLSEIDFKQEKTLAFPKKYFKTINVDALILLLLRKYELYLIFQYCYTTIFLLLLFQKLYRILLIDFELKYLFLIIF